MGKHFEVGKELPVDATPEQVWAAIATGPGTDSWFMGRTALEPGLGGAVRMEFGGYAEESRVVAWEPFERFAHRTEAGDDGRFVAYEFIIEGRDGGSTVMRTVTSGFLPGDDWAGEFEAMGHGFELFFRTLVEYVTHFAGRTATPLSVFGPPMTGWEPLHAELGLSDSPAVGDKVTALGPDAVVYFTDAHALGVRTGDALYRFMWGFGGPVIASHHLFGEAETAAYWQAWLDRVYAG
ncbi:SRPBCC domain-containing protein [Nonomuraea sp. NPDC050556]|uniref:SRPBCC domain-containing protein n=1 Tax=Nonomuraea sp. NPDC050556 TaxID=3364369 RepID=UPI00378C9E10